MTLYVSRKRMLPFSLVLTSPGEHGTPVEIFALQDSRQASRREVQLSFALPQTMGDVQPQERLDDSLMTTRFPGSFAYDVKYTSKEQEKTHHDITPATAPSAQVSEPELSTNDDGDATSSASTTVLDLNREFECDEDTDAEPAAPSNSDLCQLVDFVPPPRRRPPFREFEFESDVEAETSTISDSDVEGFGERNSPLHYQPRSLASLTQMPTLPPRFRKLYSGAAASSIPMRVVDQDADYLDSARKQSIESEGENEGEGRQPEAPTPHYAPESWPSWLTRALEAFRSLWRRLWQVGALILRNCTQNL